MAKATKKLADLLAPQTITIQLNGEEVVVELVTPSEKDAKVAVKSYITLLGRFKTDEGQELSDDQAVEFQEALTAETARWLHLCSGSEVDLGDAHALVRATGGNRSALARRCATLCGLGNLIGGEVEPEDDRSFSSRG